MTIMMIMMMMKIFTRIQIQFWIVAKHKKNSPLQSRSGELKLSSEDVGQTGRKLKPGLLHATRIP